MNLSELNTGEKLALVALLVADMAVDYQRTGATSFEAPLDLIVETRQKAERLLKLIEAMELNPRQRSDT